MLKGYTEKFRPQFHYSPKEWWLNDPNGLVYFKGEYHLFYQHHPAGRKWGPMHWGHAVSKDLIQWEELPIALYPDEYGAIFSGSAVVDWHNTTGFFPDEPGLVAIYTNHSMYPGSDRPFQRQSIAYSKDKGRTWEKYVGNPVLTDESITDFRDPKVFWHDETKKWVMILATDQTVTFYTSPNLKEWEYASEFGKSAGAHFAFWECPDLFKLSVDGDPAKEKWVMIVSIGDNPNEKEGSRTQYFIGSFDGKTFKNDHADETILWLDYGRDNYAGVSWSDIPSSDGRRIYIGWMNNWRYANYLPTEKWRGVMTLPRELQLVSTEEGIRLIQKPVAEIQKIKKERSYVVKDALISSKPLPIDLNHSLLELNIEFESINSSKFGIELYYNEQEKTIIYYDTHKNILFVDRTESGESDFSDSFSTVQEAPLKNKHNRVKLQLFIDISSIEVFANDGEAAITSLVYPKNEIKKAILFSVNGETKVPYLECMELDSIWK
ncbi:glycoside hydrolase family 32 protein [Niallia sp. 01092]|uniref:glycoside hydrolase family 32 protein n=1 Tax=unclassified Niallia TaxID=2837522 RepID=UPI003FD5B185